MARVRGDRRENFQILNGNGNQGINGGRSFGGNGGRDKGNRLDRGEAILADFVWPHKDVIDEDISNRFLRGITLQSRRP